MIAFRIFAFLWAFSAVLDLATTPLWHQSWIHAGLAASALAVMLRPGSLPLFALLNALRFAAFAVDSPATPNHQVLFAIASLSILYALIQPIRRARSLRGVSASAWLASFAPILRVELFVLYFFAVFHKLNVDYLDPGVSCSIELFQLVSPVWLFHLIRDSTLLQLATVYGSLAIEASIPLLLSWRRTRWAGVALAVVFHTFLGRHFYAFSTGLFAFFVLFVPESVFARAAGAARALRDRGDPRGWLYSPWTARAGGVALALALTAAWLEMRALGPPLIGLWIAGSLLALAGLLCVRSAWPEWAGATAGRALPSGFALVFPLLLFLNGLSPYLGLRTTPAFSMFSNLRTEGGLSNHLIVPAGALRIAGYQDDLIVILDTNDDELRRFARLGRRRIFYVFKLRIQDMAARGKHDIAVTFRRGDKVVSIARAEQNPELMTPPTWLERKLLRFRPTPIGSRRSCSW